MLGFAVQARGLQLFGQPSAGQGLGQRLAKGREQAATRVAQRLAAARAHAEQRQRLLIHRQGPPPPAAIGQGIAAMPRCLAVLPGPFGSGAFVVAQRIGFAAGQAQQALAITFEQAHLQVMPAVEVLAGRVEHGLAVGGDGQPTRQVEQLTGLRLGFAQGLQLAALTGRQVTREGGHEQEEHQGQHVFFALDAEGEVRRDEQEVVSQKRQRRTRQRRPQATAHRHQQHRGEKHQRNVRQRQHARHRPGQACRHDGGQQGQQIMPPDPHALDRRACRLRLHVAVEHVDFQPMAFAQQPRRNPGTQHTPAQAITRLPHQHQAGPALDGMLNQGARHLAGTQQHHFTAQAFSQLLRGLQALTCNFVAQTAVVHVHQAPGQMTALGHPAGMAYQAFGLVVTVDPDQQAPTQGRSLLATLAIAVGQVGIDLGRGSLHGQFTQRGEVGLGKISLDGRPRLLRHVHLAFAQALQQFTGRQVDQHQFEGFLQHPVRQGFAHLYAGDIADLVVEAFQVLDVDRGVDVDAGGQQFLNVLPALGMAAAGGIGVGQFVDQGQGRSGFEQAVQVHFLKRDTAIVAAQQGLLEQAAEQRFGLGAAVGLDHSGQYPHALALLGVGGLQHGVGLAHPWCGTEEYLQLAAASSRQVGQQRVCAGCVTHV
ncbi:hypothetical protein D3C81_794330 [compost metagenome]